MIHGLSTINFNREEVTMELSFWRLVVSSLILIQHSDSNEALKILGIFPLHGPSHFIPIGRIMRELANRGHQVDVVSHFPLSKPIPNYTDISLAGSIIQVINNMTYERTRFSMEKYIYQTGIEVCDLLSTDEFQQLLKTPKNTYDVIVIQMYTAQCFLAFGRHLNAPVVGTVTLKVPDWFAGHLGVPFNTAYMPSLFSFSSPSMTFFERLKNTLQANILTLQMNYYLDSEREHVEKYFGRKLSSISELYDDVSLLLVNSHHSLTGIMPFPPGVIEVGGIHIHDDEQVLSLEIKQWLDDSENGFVFISFGSMIKMETLPLKTLKAIYEMCENIAPVRVLMKITDSAMLPSGLPKNVMTSTWLPQIAVLKHPNIKLFITHGGMVGTQEAIAHGVPMLGIPIFGDQHTNIRTYEEKGVAIALKHEDITGESMANGVKTILTDQSYSDRTKALSKLFNDRPMKALDTAIYWIEYAARHGDVLKSPATRLSWYQYNLIDVYGFILIVFLSVLFIVKQFFTFVFKLIRLRTCKQATPNVSNAKKVE